MQRFQAVLWDIDGTLIASEPLHYEAMLASSQLWDVDLSTIAQTTFIGVNILDVWNHLKQHFPPTLTRNQWIDAINAYYTQHAHQLTVMPYGREVIATLHKQGVRQACVSNSHRTVVNANLQTLALDTAIEFSLSLNDVPIGKPSPIPYRLACKQLKLAPQDVLAVEDSSTGILSASQAGLATVGIGELLAADTTPQYHISSLKEVLHLVFTEKKGIAYELQT